MLKEKLKDFFELIVTLILDSLIILAVGFIVKGVKFVLEEWIFKTTLENCNSKAVIIVYDISKIFIIATFALYVVFDVISQIIKFIKRIKNG